MGDMDGLFREPAKPPQPTGAQVTHQDNLPPVLISFFLLPGHQASSWLNSAQRAPPPCLSLFLLPPTTFLSLSLPHPLLSPSLDLL